MKPYTIKELVGIFVIFITCFAVLIAGYIHEANAAPKLHFKTMAECKAHIEQIIPSGSWWGRGGEIWLDTPRQVSAEIVSRNSWYVAYCFDLDPDNKCNSLNVNYYFDKVGL